ncbi:hypothetical protein GCM10011533_15850 [Streptosporangium jomthongense]|uniref:Uncharacterized protein n=1 Tax=Marinobacter aromaticivorans TaxID=1494078 RepID=A0ABW2IUK5_9GAMM|nr:hypothetical protein [Marinobacter aromaticivorans]GGE64329.1 hypothetical protein GCM10011533_15850 [Streptosporangium jomthongense]
MSERQENREQQSMSMMYGTYADILFVLFPFLVIGMQSLWDGRLYETLMRADLSIAAAILAGLAIGKFVLGLVTNRDLGRYKERIVFFIAMTLFVVLGPAIILMLSIMGGAEVPGFVAFVQPVLLIIAISLYSSAVSISNILTRSDSGQNSAVVAEGQSASTAGTPQTGPAPLDLPRHNGTDTW